MGAQSSTYIPENVTTQPWAVVGMVNSTPCVWCLCHSNHFKVESIYLLLHSMRATSSSSSTSQYESSICESPLVLGILRILFVLKWKVLLKHMTIHWLHPAKTVWWLKWWLCWGLDKMLSPLLPWTSFFLQSSLQEASFALTFEKSNNEQFFSGPMKLNTIMWEWRAQLPFLSKIWNFIRV